jgi:hypothetical protein
LRGQALNENDNSQRDPPLRARHKSIAGVAVIVSFSHMGVKEAVFSFEEAFAD